MPRFPPAAAAALLVSAALACESQPADLREWRASDHEQEPGTGQGPATGPGASDDDGDPMLAARAIYNTQCRNCHGAAGRGDGPQAAMARPPDWTAPGFQLARTDEQLAASIRTGRGAMPAFGQTIRPEGIALLVRLVRELGRPPAPPSP